MNRRASALDALSADEKAIVLDHLLATRQASENRLKPMPFRSCRTRTAPPSRAMSKMLCSAGTSRN